MLLEDLIGITNSSFVILMDLVLLRYSVLFVIIEAYQAHCEVQLKLQSIIKTSYNNQSIVLLGTK